MKKFIKRMQDERTTHERRQFAVRTAGMLTAVLFVGWLATLGVRLGTGETIAENGSNTQTASLGNIFDGGSGSNTLYVATSSVLD
jgi:hypothetical protein